MHIHVYIKKVSNNKLFYMLITYYTASANEKYSYVCNRIVAKTGR